MAPFTIIHLEIQLASAYVLRAKVPLQLAFIRDASGVLGWRGTMLPMEGS